MTSNTYYLFKVNLKRAKRIWRRIALRGDQTLEDLHEAIFVAFDRYDPHLYSFYFPKAPSRRPQSGRAPKEYTDPLVFDRPDPFDDGDRFNASAATLDGLRLKKGQRFEYLFDFGDSWWHEVIVEAVEPSSPGVPFGVIEKKGASPPQYAYVDE